MNAWVERLADVDDDYLIGLSNKGIVKRAYKDKEETAAEIVSMEEEAVLKVCGESVTVCFPLGESKCSCPSRSICRHVVLAILALKEHCQKDGASGEGAGEDCAGQGDAGSPEAGEEAGNERPGPEEVPEQGAPQRKPEETIKGAVWREINEYPLEKLKKALGSRGFASFANQVSAGVRPKMQYSSVVTVQLPDQGFTVKLLSPLEYSSCTCHKKELCVHKAAAILWCQLETRTLTKESLTGGTQDAQSYDLAQIKEAAGQMRSFLEELFGTGLSRTSPDVLDYLERLAIISHNVGLARFEGYFRALSDSYDAYLARKASFRTEEIMGQMTRLYRRAGLLLQAQESGQVAGLAGEFRADYLPVGNLDLIGVGMEHFESQTGYEGETLYFLEENSKKWYTYTNARPVFYDGKKRRNYMEKSQAPWGLNLSFENLMKVRIRLTGAKCDGRRRLSSSQDTKGEILGESGLLVSDVGGWYYRDFGKLFSEQIGGRQREWLFEQEEGDGNTAQTGMELVFVQPKSCRKAEFSRTGQQLSMPLYDKKGREIIVEVTYSEQEADTIRYLERLSEKEPPCFLGKIYLRDGKLRMYPVDLPEIREDFAEKNEDMTDGGFAVPEEQEPSCKSKYVVLEELAGEIQGLMEELYQSGFSTVHDSTLQGVKKAAGLSAQYGMEYLSEMLSGLSMEIEKGRHQMERELSALAELYTDINEYLYLCKQKTAYDRGAENYGCPGE